MAMYLFWKGRFWDNKDLKVKVHALWEAWEEEK